MLEGPNKNWFVNVWPLSWYHCLLHCIFTSFFCCCLPPPSVCTRSYFVFFKMCQTTCTRSVHSSS